MKRQRERAGLAARVATGAGLLAVNAGFQAIGTWLIAISGWGLRFLNTFAHSLAL